MRGDHDLDLNLLIDLDVLLEEQSVARASRRLGVTPSAMSRRLGRLRALLGDPLLVRAGQRLVPTPRALSMRESVRAAVITARRALTSPVEDAPALTRALTIRADDAVTAGIGPALLERVQEASAQVYLRFAPQGDELAVAALRDGVIDLDIGPRSVTGPELRVRKLMDEPLAVAVSSRPGACEALDLATGFAARGHVVVSRTGRLDEHVDAALREAGLTRRVVAIVPNQLAAAALVAQTGHVAVLSAAFIDHLSTTLPIRRVAAPVPIPPRQVWMSWHPRFDDDPAHRWLRAQLDAFVAGLSPRDAR